MKKAIIILTFILYSMVAKSQSLEVSKNYVLYIFHIAKYVEWPVTHNPFVIGVLGNSKITNLMVTNYKGKVIKESSIAVCHFNNLNEAANCQILFIARTHMQYIQEAKKKFNGSNVLIITEFDNAIQMGSSINFVIDQDETLRFELSRNAVKRAGLKLNNNLLALAILVN